MPINNLKKFIPINISILTISDTRTEATDTSGQILVKKVREKVGEFLQKKMLALAFDGPLGLTKLV